MGGSVKICFIGSCDGMQHMQLGNGGGLGQVGSVRLALREVLAWFRIISGLRIGLSRVGLAFKAFR